VTFKPVSTPLQRSIRFFQHPKRWSRLLGQVFWFFK
jgi:hypothetical protein